MSQTATRTAILTLTIFALTACNQGLMNKKNAAKITQNPLTPDVAEAQKIVAKADLGFQNPYRLIPLLLWTQASLKKGSFEPAVSCEEVVVTPQQVRRLFACNGFRGEMIFDVSKAPDILVEGEIFLSGKQKSWRERLRLNFNIQEKQITVSRNELAVNSQKNPRSVVWSRGERGSFLLNVDNQIVWDFRPLTVSELNLPKDDWAFDDLFKMGETQSETKLLRTKEAPLAWNSKCQFVEGLAEIQILNLNGKVEKTGVLEINPTKGVAFKGDGKPAFSKPIPVSTACRGQTVNMASNRDKFAQITLDQGETLDTGGTHVSSTRDRDQSEPDFGLHQESTN